MALTGICNLSVTGVSADEKKEILYENKKIICKRIFQIYTSIKGKSLNIIKDLIYEKKI